MDCQQLSFSPTLGAERRGKAEKLLGQSVVTKILAVALFWLGARRPAIAAGLGTPENSLRTTVRVILRDGPGAFEDRRHHHRPCPSPAPRPAAAEAVTLAREGDVIAVRFGAMEGVLSLPVTNQVQSRVVLLSLVDSGLISAQDTAAMLGLSAVHVRHLSARLAGGDVEALRDQRRGQRQQHVLTAEVKSEIVLQYAANAMTGRSTSSRAVVADIGERCDVALSARTVRHGLAGLGLGKLTTALPELVDRIKKGSGR